MQQQHKMLSRNSFALTSLCRRVRVRARADVIRSSAAAEIDEESETEEKATRFQTSRTLFLFKAAHLLTSRQCSIT